MSAGLRRGDSRCVDTDTRGQEKTASASKTRLHLLARPGGDSLGDRPCAHLETELPGQYVDGAERHPRQRGTPSALAAIITETVHHLIERAVSARRRDHVERTVVLGRRRGGKGPGVARPPGLANGRDTAGSGQVVNRPPVQPVAAAPRDRIEDHEDAAGSRLDCAQAGRTQMAMSWKTAPPFGGAASAPVKALMPIPPANAAFG